ncbi:MAG: 3-hydroxyanthranilate 3,4-dioxygenase [Acidimicrobiales bacterium]|nr:3-hydroxyanthranilate 3,4-dioxygenase [Acidimicrobiales bacterium]
MDEVAMTDYDPAPKERRPFNLGAWIQDHCEDLTPPVANRQIWREADMIVMIVGGGNERNDFHDDPREEFFYQIKGDMDLMIWMEEGTPPFRMPIREGEVYLLPSGVRHSPQRPDLDSIGLVVEYQRDIGELDGFEWVCFSCAHLVRRVELQVQSIDADLPPLFAAFNADDSMRTCPNCGDLHPGTSARL